MNSFILVLLIHWFADFVCQTRMMANNKSKSSLWLLAHVLVYSAIMCIFGFKFALVNGAAHLLTDDASSKLTAYFCKKKNMHMFFTVIGFDQFIHTATLYLTWQHML